MVCNGFSATSVCVWGSVVSGKPFCFTKGSAMSWPATVVKLSGWQVGSPSGSGSCGGADWGAAGGAAGGVQTFASLWGLDIRSPVTCFHEYIVLWFS